MINFPSLPAYRAEWRAVQFETIPGSGERFTFAVLARGEDGRTDIRDALKPGVLRAMFGPQADVLQGLMIRSIINIKAHLKQGGSWQEPPIALSNIFLGPIRPTVADDLEQVLDQAIRLSACLGHSTIGESTDAEINVDAEIKEWASRVKSFAMTMDENLKHYFNKRVKGNDTKVSRSVIGFMTDRYAASFGVLHARSDRISADITAIKKRLWDLSQLSHSGQLLVPKERELIVGHPAFELIEKNKRMVATLQHKLSILREEAANAEIGVKEATTPMEAADYLVKKVVNG
jgi:hypothetical protein